MLAKLKKLFPDFKFTKSEIKGLPCYHGVINVSPFTKREGKDRIRYGNVTLFISSEMYKGEEKSFFYGLISQKTTFFGYRKQNGIEMESNKIVCSNKSCEQLIMDLAKEFDKNKYKLT